jgi:hypothetical protein
MTGLSQRFMNDLSECVLAPSPGPGAGRPEPLPGDPRRLRQHLLPGREPSEAVDRPGWVPTRPVTARVEACEDWGIQEKAPGVSDRGFCELVAARLVVGRPNWLG